MHGLWQPLLGLKTRPTAEDTQKASAVGPLVWGFSQASVWSYSLTPLTVFVPAGTNRQA